MIYSCSDDGNYSELCSFVDKCLYLLNTYRFLTDSYILEFFIEEQWKMLPSIWRRSFETFTIEDVHDLMAGKQLANVLPLSLLCFRQCTKMYKLENEMHTFHNANMFDERHFQLPERVNPLMKIFRESVRSISTIEQKFGIFLPLDLLQQSYQNEKLEENVKRNNPSCKDETSELTSHRTVADSVLAIANLGTEKLTKFSANEEKVQINKITTTEIASAQVNVRNPELIDRHLNRHLTPKKRHEIDKLSNMIHSIVERNCRLFDVGAGQGLLSRMLAFKFDFSDIISVDCNVNLLSKAHQFDDQLIKDFRCFESNIRPTQLNYRINKENYDRLIENAIDQKFGLIGLHTCGNLSHDLLELHKNSASKYLFLCSCCYHKTAENRYLISEHLRKSEITLSVETRANACHFLDKFVDSLQTKPDELKAHLYRALLEQLLELKSPTNRKRTLAKVHNLSSKTFHQYIESVLRNNKTVIDELELQTDEISSLVQSRLGEWLNILIFYALRTLLGPVTESVLLVDRMLFLYEGKQIKSKLIPLFDAKVSPRNFLLMSTKESQIV